MSVPPTFFLIKYDAHILFYNYGGGVWCWFRGRNMAFPFCGFVFELTKVMEGPRLFKTVQHIPKKERWEKKKETRTRILWL